MRVTNYDTGRNINADERKIYRGTVYVKLSGSNFWYKVFPGGYITKGMPFLYDNGNMVQAPNNNRNEMNVFAVVPRGYSATKNGKIYLNSNFPGNKQKYAGLSIQVKRNARGLPWRLVNKNLAARFNLEMKLSRAFGLWAGRLFAKNQTNRNT